MQLSLGTSVYINTVMVGSSDNFLVQRGMNGKSRSPNTGGSVNLAKFWSPGKTLAQRGMNGDLEYPNTCASINYVMAGLNSWSQRNG